MRPGFRVAFSLASRPVSPNSRRSGQPTTSTTKGTSRGVTMATATNRSTEPTAMVSRRVEVLGLPTTPNTP